MPPPSPALSFKDCSERPLSPSLSKHRCCFISNEQCSNTTMAWKRHFAVTFLGHTSLHLSFSVCPKRMAASHKHPWLSAGNWTKVTSRGESALISDGYPLTVECQWPCTRLMISLSSKAPACHPPPLSIPAFHLSIGIRSAPNLLDTADIIVQHSSVRFVHQKTLADIFLLPGSYAGFQEKPTWRLQSHRIFSRFNNRIFEGRISSFSKIILGRFQQFRITIKIWRSQHHVFERCLQGRAHLHRFWGHLPTMKDKRMRAFHIPDHQAKKFYSSSIKILSKFLNKVKVECQVEGGLGRQNNTVVW